MNAIASAHNFIHATKFLSVLVFVEFADEYQNVPLRL